jgi:hypothetical protein
MEEPVAETRSLLLLSVLASAAFIAPLSAQDWEADRRLTWSDGVSETSINYNVGAPRRPTRTQIRDLATGAERPLSQPALGMTWSADGGEILGYTIEREIVICTVATGACRAIATRAHSAVWGPDERSVYFLRGPERLEDPTIGRVHVFAVGVDGAGERPVADLAPIIVFGKSLAVSPHGEILWTKYLRGLHQIWLADLP